MDEKKSAACKPIVQAFGLIFRRDFWRLPQRNDWELLLVTLLVYCVAVFAFLKCYGRGAFLPKQGKHRVESLTDNEDRPKSFYDTDGISGYNYNIVPDIIHLVRYNQPELTFIDVVCLRSMYLNHRPKKIYVHCDPCGFRGTYTRLVEGISFTFISTVFPKEVFGIEIKDPHHSTDVARLRALLYYGGIYLDGDVFVVQSLRRFLQYEATISCQEQGSFGNMIMIFHKNSRFLRLYMDTYHEFNGSIWYFNAGHLPTRALVQPHPHLGHRMYYGLETETDMLGIMYGPHAYPHWRSILAVHTLSNHRGQAESDPLYNVALNESNVRDYDTALGQMARSVLFGTSDFVPPDAPILSVAELAARVDRGENITKTSPERQRPFFRKVLEEE